MPMELVIFFLVDKGLGTIRRIPIVKPLEGGD
jgi:hypothetical protein